jgi:hypothetical protein
MSPQIPKGTTSIAPFDLYGFEWGDETSLTFLDVELTGYVAGNPPCYTFKAEDSKYRDLKRREQIKVMYKGEEVGTLFTLEFWVHPLKQGSKGDVLKRGEYTIKGSLVFDTLIPDTPLATIFKGFDIVEVDTKPPTNTVRVLGVKLNGMEDGRWLFTAEEIQPYR